MQVSLTANMMYVKAGMLIAAGNREHHTGPLSHQEDLRAGGWGGGVGGDALRAAALLSRSSPFHHSAQQLVSVSS